MGDVLSQSEVEALLSALDQGAVEAAPARGKPTREARPASAPVALPEDITLYDFKRPERVSKEHMQALQSMHESFSRSLGPSLSGMLRTIVDVNLVSVDQLTYSEFIFSLENPTCMNVLRCAPLKGFIVLEINPTVVYPIIDRLLGGGQVENLIPRRPLTDIEVSLVGRVTKILTDELTATWAKVAHIDFSVDRIESNPQLVQIVPPNEVVVLMSIEMAIGESRGMTNLCIPFNVIEPIAGKLAANIWLSSDQREQSREKDVIRSLANAPLEMVTYVGETSITAENLLNLQVGDLLPIEKAAQSQLLISVAGVPKFRGTPFVMHGRKVVRIDERCEPHSRING